VAEVLVRLVLLVLLAAMVELALQLLSQVHQSRAQVVAVVVLAELFRQQVPEAREAAVLAHPTTPLQHLERQTQAAAAVAVETSRQH
jgi:hypothetical protein